MTYKEFIAGTDLPKGWSVGDCSPLDGTDGLEGIRMVDDNDSAEPFMRVEYLRSGKVELIKDGFDELELVKLFDNQPYLQE